MDNPIATPSPAPLTPPPTPPATREKSVIPIVLAVLFFLALLATVILAYQNWLLNQRLNAIISAPNPSPSPTTTVTPSATISPTSNPTSTPTRNIKTLKYSLPTGWKTIENSSGKFEVGYDPSTMKTEPLDSAVYLSKPKTTPGTWQFMMVKLLPYSGGSRHQFIYDGLGEKPQAQDLGPNYREVEYLYNNRSCLFLLGISISQYPQTWGMCDAGGGEAFLIWSYSETAYEEVVQTIRQL